MGIGKQYPDAFDVQEKNCLITAQIPYYACMYMFHRE